MKTIREIHDRYLSDNEGIEPTEEELDQILGDWADHARDREIDWIGEELTAIIEPPHRPNGPMKR